MSQDIKQFSDQELFRKCKEYGLNARMWMKKFAGLLPEVYRRRLYKRKGCASIHEFAAKLAGMNQTTVDKILNLSKRLVGKPKLTELLETGACGWSKLEKVAYQATPETDQFWAEKAKTLPLHALEAYVRESRKESNVQSNRSEFTLESDGQYNLQVSEVPENKTSKITIPMPLDPEIHGQLLLFKQKIEKEKGEKLDWNMVMKKLLTGYADDTKKPEPQKIIQLCPECVQKQENEREKDHEVTRHIPAESRKIIQERSQEICEYPNCHRPGEIYHHTRRFAIKKNHDPAYIRFLCKGHEGILQMGLVENEENEPYSWKLRDEPEWFDLKNLVDTRVAEFRREPVPAE